MSLRAHTARINYRGPDRLDVTRKSGDPIFAPSWAILGPALAKRRAAILDVVAWEEYRDAYRYEMGWSQRVNSAIWRALLAREEVTLLCYCTDPARCHRTVLAEILVGLGAEYLGERGKL